MKRRASVTKLTDPARYEPFLAIRNEREYDSAVSRLHQLVDEIGDNPNNPRYRFIDTLSVLIEAYDQEHYPIASATPIELLRFLIEQHGLSQSALPEIGSQGVVSEILRGKRELNVRQIRALSRRFNLPPEAFFPEAEFKRQAV